MQVLIVALVAVAVGYAVYKLKKKRADEDRPEIIVRNRKLRLDHDKEWRRLGSDRRWKPDHDAGRSVAKYVVSIPGSSCGPLEGTVVEVFFRVGSDDHILTWTLVEDSTRGIFEPVLDAPDDLEHAGNGKTLKIKLDPDGGIAKVRVDRDDSRACSFTVGDEVKLSFDLNQP